MAITVLGHINPDTDTTCSAIAYAWYLSETGNEAAAVSTGSLNKETELVLSRFKQETPPLLQGLTENHTIAIVDTNNPEELLPGWDKATIISIVDHHKLVGGISTPGPVSVIMQPVACTATLILGLMDQSNLTPSKEVAGIMLASIISDTLNFTSPTSTDTDKRAAERLAEIAGENMDELATDMFAAKSDLTGMSVHDILSVDSKVFTIGNEKIRISVLESTRPENALILRSELEAAMADLKEQDGLTAAWFFVVDILESKATLIAPSSHEKELAVKTFGLPFDGDLLVLPGVVSRKKQIVPNLESALS
ncbi:MAG TPA: manganese-dependent inorganic pyrophosphatase [Verrucomicrobiae bacterium]|nr:manganese-dependent inorganic pyrophosphatase [Verrucomicrobiae bacterium]